MQEKSSRNRAPGVVKFASVISPERRKWWRAMLAETEHIDGRLDRWLWRAGIGVALLRLVLRKATTDDVCRPFELTATAFYLAGFSTYIFTHLVTELLFAGVREPWYESCLPIALCFWLAIIPLLIAIGLWVCDDLARKCVIGFAALELIMVVCYAHSFGATDVRLVKFLCNLAILVAMFTPRVRNACSWRGDPQQSLLKLSD